jgi:hypothetical protein
VELQNLAQEYHQGFRNVVEHESVGIPVRSAYRYIALYKQAKKIKPRIAALVIQAGYDPAEKRIQTQLNSKSLRAKVNKMTAAELAKKLAKGAGKTVSPRFLFLRALKAYTKYLIHEEYDLREIQSRLGQMIKKSVTPRLVRKAA